jgi:hypothetical protein
LAIINGHALAAAVHIAEIVLCRCVALFGRLQVPRQRRAVVFGDALAFGVLDAEAELGAGIALLGERPPRV